MSSFTANTLRVLTACAEGASCAPSALRTSDGVIYIYEVKVGARRWVGNTGRYDIELLALAHIAPGTSRKIWRLLTQAATSSGMGVQLVHAFDVQVACALCGWHHEADQCFANGGDLVCEVGVATFNAENNARDARRMKLIATNLHESTYAAIEAGAKAFVRPSILGLTKRADWTLATTVAKAVKRQLWIDDSIDALFRALPRHLRADVAPAVQNDPQLRDALHAVLDTNQPNAVRNFARYQLVNFLR